MKIQPILSIPKTSFNTKLNCVAFSNAYDSTSFENPNINKKPLIERGILPKDYDVNLFFDKISQAIFQDKTKQVYFSTMLKTGKITLSTNCYTDLSNPASAIGIKLNPKKTTKQHIALLEKHIQEGRGVGINFSNIKNPIQEIQEINSYFKFRQPNTKRAPAGIALLNVDNKNIIDFIRLKNIASYSDWCFDLSVVLPSDFFLKVDNNEDITLSDGNKIKAKMIYYELLNSMLKSGEPGVIFSNDKEYICDCCATTQLKPDEKLTLAHINLAKFFNKNSNQYDFNSLAQSANLLAEAMSKIDNNGYIGILGYEDLINSTGLTYGQEQANQFLATILQTIKQEALKHNIKKAIAPTGNSSRIVKASPSIEIKDNSQTSYWEELDTLACAQKFLDGNISKTINLKPYHTTKDIDNIVRYCATQGIKGITVFPKN